MSIEKLVENIEKNLGVGTIMLYGDQAHETPEVIPTGVPTLDTALGVGGIPKGRIIEIYGPESSGKTTLSLTILAQCQKEGGQVAFIDAEHALDPVYALAIGVDMDNVLLSQPDSGEQALEVLEALVRSQEVQLIVVDSVAALTPRSEIDGEMGDAAPGKQARLMSQAMRKLVAITAKNNCTIIFINQLRHKIGVMYGSPETTTGGMALKFYCSIRIDIRRIGAVKNGEDSVGNKTRIKIVKNKLAPPHKETEVDIIYGEGISLESSILDSALDAGVITKKGAWFAFDGKNFGQGRENARKELKNNGEFRDTVLAKLKEETK
jgi:recombination protein RecA